VAPLPAPNFFTAADEGARAVPFDNGSSPSDPFFSLSCLKGLSSLSFPAVSPGARRSPFSQSLSSPSCLPPTDHARIPLKIELSIAEAKASLSVLLSARSERRTRRPVIVIVQFVIQWSQKLGGLPLPLWEKLVAWTFSPDPVTVLLFPSLTFLAGERK